MRWLSSFVIVLCIHSLSFAQELNPVKWTVELQSVSDGEFQLIYKAAIDKGWNVYGQDIEEGGPIPTAVSYDNPEVIELIGKSEETGYRKDGMDPIFKMNVTKFYSNEPYVITQKVKVLDKSQPLIGFVEYMTCDEEQCLPPVYLPFSFDFKTGKAKFLSDEEEAGAIADIEGNVIDQIRPALLETYENPLADCGDTSTKQNTLPLMFLFGFLGGLFALLTPCVFPMIPLTVSFFTKDNKRKGWKNALIYGASIIVIYVSIGLLITLLFGDEALNRLSTNWIANSIFFLIFIVFAFSFFGFYEIQLPSSWANKSDTMADKGGLLGIFFMAFTLALVSFSCTGPIIGTAIVQAASSQLGPFIVMLGFSIALALPFGLFAAFPSWLNSLPKSGGWMNSVKVVLGFIELALAFKFLSVADMTNHWGFLKYEVFMGIWVIVAIAMALYGFGIIKFPHDSPLKKMSPRRWVYTLGCVGLALYLASGFIYKKEYNSYNSLKLLSGIAPPSNYNFFLPENEIDQTIKAQYPSYSKCANNINCFKDYYEGLAYARAEGKPVFLDHTGHGCVNCRKTEEHIWIDNDVREKLNNDFVLVSLYVDDDKALEQPLLSKSRNKIMRNVGNKWADFQIVNFRQNSQPLYVMITPDEEVISHPRGYKDDTEDYRDYLECGLSTFKSLQ